MAAVTAVMGTGDTTTSPNTSGAFTPNDGALLAVIIATFDSLDNPPTLSGSASLTWYYVGRCARAASVSFMYCWVAEQAASAVSQTVTITNAGDEWTGTNTVVYGVDGMTKFGSAAVRQFAVDEDNGSGTTPETIFGVSALTDNPTIVAVFNSVNPPAITPPAGWTEDGTYGEVGHATPDHGLASAYRDSGFTGTTITWGSTYGSAGGAIALELDASASAANSLAWCVA